MIITKTKIKEKLKKHLKREPSVSETINAKQDINILIEILIDEFEILNEKVANLYKIKKDK